MWPNNPQNFVPGPGYPTQPQQGNYPASPQQGNYPPSPQQGNYPTQPQPGNYPAASGQNIGFATPGFPNLPTNPQQQTQYSGSTPYPTLPTSTPQAPYTGPATAPYPGQTTYVGQHPYSVPPPQTSFPTTAGFPQNNSSSATQVYYPAPGVGYPPIPAPQLASVFGDQQQLPPGTLYNQFPNNTTRLGYPPVPVPSSAGSFGQQQTPTPASGSGVPPYTTNVNYPGVHAGDQSQTGPYTLHPGPQVSRSTPPYTVNMQQYPDIPTIRPSNADAMADAQVLRKAMKGFGTDETAIINVLAKRTNAERQNIAQAYKQSFGKDLIKDLKSELGGRLEQVVVSMMTPYYDYVAENLHKAMSGLGTKESCLIDVLCTSSNAEIRAINAAYYKLYGKPLEKDIMGDTSGHFGRLMVSMSTGNRVENPTIDHAIAIADAQALLKAGEKKWGTDESSFNAILATRSWPQLREMFQEYEKLTGHAFEKAIKSEFSGDVESGMLAVVKCAKNRAAYFAGRLHNCVKGMGTVDNDLIFIIITRSEIDLESIKQEYHRAYNKSLASDISGDTSGDYKKILLAILN